MSWLRRLGDFMTSGGYSLIDRQADEASSSASCEYVCKTCGETVYTDDPKLHKHWCPLEPGDKCGARKCNETGICQA